MEVTYPPGAECFAGLGGHVEFVAVLDDALLLFIWSVCDTRERLDSNWTYHTRV